MGFLAKAEKAIDYFDRCMMYFPNSYPALQMAGRPVPGHATVMANKPHIYFDELSKWAGLKSSRLVTMATRRQMATDF